MLAPDNGPRRWLSFAEGVGSFLLVFAGAAVLCLGARADSLPGRAVLALASGAALCGITFVARHLSGAYLNPAVTLAAVLVRELPGNLGVSYVIAQLAGAACAGVALRLLVPTAVAVGLGVPALDAETSFAQGVVIEAIVSFAWVCTVAATSWRGAHTGKCALTLGGVYAACVLSLAPITGASGNPARAFGPAFASGSYDNHLLYWVGPFLGAALPALGYFALFHWRSRGTDSPRDGSPREARALYKQGLALYRAGQLEEAAAQFALATERFPEWPDPYYCIGLIYRDVGDEKNAAAFFDAALSYRRARGNAQPGSELEG